jgi:hypothetical protein
MNCSRLNSIKITVFSKHDKRVQDELTWQPGEEGDIQKGIEQIGQI